MIRLRYLLEHSSDSVVVEMDKHLIIWLRTNSIRRDSILTYIRAFVHRSRVHEKLASPDIAESGYGMLVVCLR